MTQDSSLAGVQFNGQAVSCPTSSFCMAVGDQSVSGEGQLFSETWNGSTWTNVPVPLPPSPSAGGILHSVSCSTPIWCMAVGSTNDSGFAHVYPLVEMWNGSAWKIVSAPSVPAQTDLWSISCLNTSSCMVVGSLDIGSGAANVSQWNGTSWTTTTLTLPSGATTAALRGVSCTYPSPCMAVGWFDAGTGVFPLAYQWNGTSWAQGTTPSDSSVTDLRLWSVSCTGAWCAAVGAGDNGSLATRVNEIETWNGSGPWQLATGVPQPTPGKGQTLSDVSCFSATSCAAVGTVGLSASGGSEQALTWNGQAWSSATTPNEGTSNDAGLGGVSCLTNWACVAVGTVYTVGPELGLNLVAPIARSGYRFVASDGGIFAYGPGAPFVGSLGGTPLNAPIVGMGVMPAGDGYYLVATDGGVFAYGSAKFYGSMGGMKLNKPVVGMAVTPDGAGYWLVASDGGIFSFGDAQFYGSTGGIPLNKPVVGMASSPDGQGYYLVASDGGIFNYGPAAFFWGSTGSTTLNKPIVGIGVTTGGQYYLVASDGGIFAFPGGAAGPPFYGSTGGTTLNKPIIGMTVVQGGYYLSGSDGGIFAFPTGAGGLPFYGSTGNIMLNKPIVGVAS